MKFLKGLLTVVVGLTALFVIGSLILPGEQHVERSVVVAAEPADIERGLERLRALAES